MRVPGRRDPSRAPVARQTRQNGLAPRGALAYAPRMRRLSVLLLLGILAGPALADTGDQAVEDVTAPTEQRIEILDAGEQAVVPVEVQGEHGVSEVVPPSAAEKAASTAGKVVLAVGAAAVSIGFTVASLMLF